MAAAGPAKSSGIVAVLVQEPGEALGHEISVSVYLAAAGLEQFTLADTVATPLSCAITAPAVPQEPT